MFPKKVAAYTCCTLCILVLTAFYCPAQTAVIDSLQTVLQSSRQDTTRVNTLTQLARRIKASDTEQADVYVSEALTLAKQLEFTSGIIYAYNTKGMILQDQGDLARARLYCDSSLQLARTVNDRYGIAMSMNNLGLIGLDQGNFEEGLIFLTGAAELRAEIGDRKGEAGSYNNLGLLYEYMGQHEQAIKSHERSLAIKKEIGDQQGVANSYLNIGLSYGGLPDTAQERSNYRKALEIYIATGDKKGQSMAYNNLGEVYMQDSAYDRSIAYLSKAYELRKDLQDIRGQAQTGTNIAACLLRMGRVDEAESYLYASLKLATEAQSKKEIALAYAGLSDLFAVRKDFPAALEAYKKYASYKDSLINEESAYHLEEMQAKYESEKKEKAILALEAEAQRAAYERNLVIVIVSAGILLLLAGSWFWLLRYKARKEKEQELAILETKQTERVRIARDMHDDIGSGLSRISLLSEQIKATLNTSGKPVDSDKTVHGLSKLAAESRQLTGNIGEIIWTMSPKNDTLDSLVAYLRSYTYDYLDQADVGCTVDAPDEIPSVTVSAEVRRNVFLVLKESLHNIVKHAEATHVRVRMTFDAQQLSLVIHDNGRGLQQATKYSGGNGLNNMRKRMEECGATYAIRNAPEGGVMTEISGLRLKNTTKV